MTEQHHSALQFAICIKTDDADLLTPRRIYQILPDDSAARSHYVRVIDNEGEDYLYPADYFIFMEFPHEVEQTLLQASEADLAVSVARAEARGHPEHV
jgi:hypothetical protein